MGFCLQLDQVGVLNLDSETLNGHDGVDLRASADSVSNYTGIKMERKMERATDPSRYYTTCDQNGPGLRLDRFRTANNAGKCGKKKERCLESATSLHVASAIAAKFEYGRN
jgi:hypothetical protein